MRLAVVGAGWAGLAAAVRASEAGHEVSLFEMAAQAGGRARTVAAGDLLLDNGQHILIGAYARTLALMRTVQADMAALDRRPLELRYPDGRGLRLPAGPAWLAFGVGVAGCRGFGIADKLALMRASAGWALAGFRCDAALTVDRLCARLPPAVRALLIDPLCVAALNTPATEASAQVLLRVLRDALFGGRGAADLLLPRRPLGTLLPEPALHWLRTHGAAWHPSARVQQLQPAPGGGWLVDGERFDGVVLACTAAEAARLAGASNPGWAERARSLPYEPIVTVWLRAPGSRLPSPMTALIEGPLAPAQFAFDHGALGGSDGVHAFVVSGARRWVDAGLEATGQAVVVQALAAFPAGTWPTAPTVLHAAAEKRATFRCTPGLDRPPALVAPGLVAAGDYIEGPYPATLEGAVRAGETAVALLSAAG